MPFAPPAFKDPPLNPSDIPNDFEGWILRQVRPWGLDLAADDLARMRDHLKALLEANTRFNVTRITHPARAAVLHYADSLAIVAWRLSSRPEPTRSAGAEVEAEGELNVLDVGTGGGFPAVPVAIARPHWRVTAIDGTGKKVEFLRAWAAEAGLANLMTAAARAESFWPQSRFDLVLARAVSPLDRLMRACRHLVAPGGRLVAYKTPHMKAEEAEASIRAAAQFRWARESDFDYELMIPPEPAAQNAASLDGGEAAEEPMIRAQADAVPQAEAVAEESASRAERAERKLVIFRR